MKKKQPLLLVLSVYVGLLSGAFAQASESPSTPKIDYPGKGMIPNSNMLHIGIVVRDIEAAMKHWATFLGVEEIPNILTTGNSEANPTHHRGHPTNARAHLAFFTLENLQVELIQPIDDDPSSWKEFLEAKGEGVHHIGFGVKGIGEAYLEKYEKAGMPVVHKGGWDTGEFAYMETDPALGVIVELLEFYNQE